MKKQLSVVLLGVASLLAIETQGQKIRLAEGDLKALAGEKEINLEFDYANMRVGKGTEADYVSKKKDDYNKKESGKGDTWVKAWTEDRETRYEPRFISAFSQFSGLTGGPLASAKYTLVVKTIFTEPGYNIAVMRKNANIDLEVLLVATADKSKVLGKITVDNSPGGTFFENDFDAGERIAEAYKNAGMSVGGFVRSKSH